MADYLQRLPLYHSSQHNKDHIDLFNRDTNKGLLFERFFGGYDLNWGVDKLQKDSLKQTHPLNWLTGQCGNAKALARSSERQLDLVAALDGKAISCDLDWNMVTGTGEAHPLENGFRWHHSYGVPYLPASSIKGMLRAWLCTWARGSFSDQEVLDLFGNEPEKEDGQHIGSLIFFDALPLTPATLTLDVMTPHAGPWYEKGASQAGQADTVPADWQSPVPITFLAVKNACFLFTIAGRDAKTQALLPRVMEQLTEALANMGIGAKTAVGYGTMTKKAAQEQGSGERLLAELQQKRSQQRTDRKRQLERAAMTPNQLEIAKLSENLNRREDKQHKEGFNSDIEGLVKSALNSGWSKQEREKLAQVIEQDSVWTQIAKKDKARERKSLLAQLKE